MIDEHNFKDQALVLRYSISLSTVSLFCLDRLSLAAVFRTLTEFDNFMTFRACSNNCLYISGQNLYLACNTQWYLMRENDL